MIFACGSLNRCHAADRADVLGLVGGIGNGNRDGRADGPERLTGFMLARLDWRCHRQSAGPDRAAKIGAQFLPFVW